MRVSRSILSDERQADPTQVLYRRSAGTRAVTRGEMNQYSECLSLLERLSEALEDPIAIVGGLAAIHYSAEVTTLDIDISVSKEKLDSIVEEVVNHAVEAVGEPLEGNGSALHVREEALESTAIVGVDVPRGIDVEAGVFPSPHPLHGLGADLLSAEHEPEESLAEEDFEPGEVDVFHGEEDAVGTEEAERADGVGVGVVREKVPVTLGGDDHGRDGLAGAWKQAGTLSEEVAGGGVGKLREFAVEGAIEEEGLPERKGDGEDELAVLHARQHALDHSLGPLDRTALTAGGAKVP